MRLFFNWLVSAIAIVIAAYLLPGVSVSNFMTALVLAVVLGAINIVLRPILLLLTLPITILTLGLFALILNGLLIMLAAVIVPGFSVDGFWWAILYAIVLSLVTWILERFGKN